MNKEISAYIENIYIEMFLQLYNYAYSLLGNEERAKEAVQETFRIACVKPKKLMTSENPHGWLTNTLKYVIKTMQRADLKFDKIVARALFYHAQSKASTDMEVAVEILYEDLINNDNFQLIKKLVIDNYTIAELAEELGISMVACRKRISRAKVDLKKKMKKY